MNVWWVYILKVIQITSQITLDTLFSNLHMTQVISKKNNFEKTKQKLMRKMANNKQQTQKIRKM